MILLSFPLNSCSELFFFFKEIEYSYLKYYFHIKTWRVTKKTINFYVKKPVVFSVRLLHSCRRKYTKILGTIKFIALIRKQLLYQTFFFFLNWYSWRVMNKKPFYTLFNPLLGFTPLMGRTFSMLVRDMQWRIQVGKGEIPPLFKK